MVGKVVSQVHRQRLDISKVGLIFRIDNMIIQKTILISQKKKREKRKNYEAINNMQSKQTDLKQYEKKTKIILTKEEPPRRTTSWTFLLYSPLKIAA